MIIKRPAAAALALVILAGCTFSGGSGQTAAPAAGIAFLAGFYLLLIGSMVFIVLLFGLMRGSNPAILRALIGLSALALFVLGVVRLVTGLVPYLT
jgi:hypothetical protein